MSDRETSIGFVGLGHMGLPIARRLRAAPAGIVLIGHDTDPARTAALGAPSADSVAALAQRAQCVFTCLPAEDVVREIYLGPAGLYAAAGPELRVTCDLSTISPDLGIELSRAASARGIRHIEAPMIGGVPEAETGRLYLVVAGEGMTGLEDVPTPLASLLPHISRKAILAGPPGSAARMKIVQNGLGLIQLVGIAEALATCRRIGLDPHRFAQFVTEAGGMAGRPLFAEVAPLMLDAPAVSTASIAIAAKDAALFAELASALGDGLVSQASAAQLRRATDTLGDIDYTQIIRLFDSPPESAGV